MNIYVFGNSFVPGDSTALILYPQLQKKFSSVSFIPVDPNENFPPQCERNIIILDTVQSLHEVSLFDFDDLADVDKSPVSPHDYDILLHLLLLKKTGRIDRVTIIGLPYRVKKKIALKKVEHIISTLLLKSGKRKTYRGQKRG